jgi:hypothetical protein
MSFTGTEHHNKHPEGAKDFYVSFTRSDGLCPLGSAAICNRVLAGPTLQFYFDWFWNWKTTSDMHLHKLICRRMLFFLMERDLFVIIVLSYMYRTENMVEWYLPQVKL